MSNETKTRRTSKENETKVKGLKVAMINKDFAGYGGQGKPKYDLLENYGTTRVINDLKNVYTDFYEMRADLEVEESAIIRSSKEFAHTLGINTGDNIIQFAGLVHGAKGPIVDTEMHIIKVVANDDIEYDGEVVVEKGKELLKAVTSEYLAKLKKA